MNKTFEASGKTVEEAIDRALLLANTTIENVDIEVLELGGRGVFGFGKKDARVRITQEVEEPQEEYVPKAREPKSSRGRAQDKAAAVAEDEAPVIKEMIRPRSAATEDTGKPARAKESKNTENQQKEQQQKETPVKEASPKETAGKENKSRNVAGGGPRDNARNKNKEQGGNRQRERYTNNERGERPDRGYRVSEGDEADALTAAAQSFLDPIFKRLKVEPQQQSCVKEGILWLVFSGQGLGSLIGRRGETLNALQYLTNLAVNRDKKEHVRLVLDVEGYRAGREETLVALAKKMADKAVRSGRRVELEPMNPHERRIVHIALQNDKRVDTMSQGEEPYRKVVINRRRSEGGYKRRPSVKSEAAPATEKMTLSQQLGQQFSEQMERR